MTHLLLLEDDATLASHWQWALESLGVRVTQCKTAADAIRVFDEESIDIVISDIFIRGTAEAMKSEGGISLISHISLQTIGKKRPPIICVTGAHATLDLPRWLKVFAVERIFTKPVDTIELVMCAKRFIEQTEPTNDSQPDRRQEKDGQVANADESSGGESSESEA